MTNRPREQALKSYYDNKLSYYSPANLADMIRIMALVGPPTPASGHLLDVGCGDGRAAEWAKTFGYRYTGIDYSEARIAKAREYFGDQIEQQWVAGDLYETLPLLSPGYEFIWCCELLEHLEQPEIIWAEMQRLCSGMVVCTCPVNMPYKSHLQVFKNDVDLHVKFPGITNIYRVHCQTPGGNLREHFVFTYEAPRE